MSNVQLNSPVVDMSHNDNNINTTTTAEISLKAEEQQCNNVAAAVAPTSSCISPDNNLDIIQDMIDLSANHLEGLRTQCATSVSLTQQEIRSLESKLVRYFSELLLTKARLNERIPASGLPHKTGSELKQWLRVVGLSQESLNVCLTRLSTLEQLLEQSDEELKQMLCNNPSYREEEVRRLTKAMHNLRKCKELLSGSAAASAADSREQLTEQWYWDSWDRHHHIHRGSIGNIGLTTTSSSSPRTHHRQHAKQTKSNTAPISLVSSTTTTTITRSGRQSPTNSEQQATNSNSKTDDANSVQGSTLTLTLTPSPPNSPFTPSSSGIVANSVKSTPQRNKTVGTPPPIRKLQTQLNNATPTHIVSVVQDSSIATDKPVDSPHIVQQAEIITPQPMRSRLPTDPSPDSYSSASSDIFIEHNNNSNMLHVPCSPGTGHVGMGHAISHRFTKVLKIMSTCNHCQKPMFIGLKCKDCKYRCHKDCEPNVPPSCGLPREYVDEFKQTFIKDQAGFPTMQHAVAGGGSPNFKKNTLTKPRHNHGDSSSPSSSCTSSTPSSPALFHLQQQQQHNAASNYITGGSSSVMCSSAGGSSSTTSSNMIPTPSAFQKLQTSQFNFPDVTITTSNTNSNTMGSGGGGGVGGNNTQTLLYASQMQTSETSNNSTTTAATANVELTTQQQLSSGNVLSHVTTTTATSGSSSNSNNKQQQHYNGNSGNNSLVNSIIGSQMSTNSSNITSFTASLASTGTSTFYPRKLSSAGVDKRIPFTSELSDTHKSNDSDKTVSLSGSTSASTDSDRTPVRLDSTEDGDSGNWPRQNSLSLKEWDIPYGDLRLLEQIGKGRFGTVHRAHWHGDVAVKLLKEDYLDDEDMLETFKKEVANFKKTRHENLVLFMGACMNPPYLAIVTSLCKGNTLYTYIHQRREKFAINRTLLIAQQIAQGMGYLHARGIVHKDLRTKNIFIENGKVIITDFGLFSSTKLFYCDIGLGIPHNWLCYMAPELMRALMPRKPTDECLPFSPGSDVYSFGTVWYELICGEFTFKDQPAESIIWQVGRGMKQTLANLQSGRDVKDLLMLCWTYLPEDRPDFARLLQLLEHLPKKRLARSPSHPVNLSRSAESVF